MYQVTQQERVTKGYAHGLLAQIALTRAGWAIREEAKSGYETATDYSDPVYPTQRPDADTRKSLYEKALEHLGNYLQRSPSVEPFVLRRVVLAEPIDVRPKLP